MAKKDKRSINFGDLSQHFYSTYGKGAFVYRENKPYYYATREDFDFPDTYLMDIIDYSQSVLILYFFPGQNTYASLLCFPIDNCPLTIDAKLENIKEVIENYQTPITYKNRSKISYN
jgi:hypothetical protein